MMVDARGTQIQPGQHVAWGSHTYNKQISLRWGKVKWVKEDKIGVEAMDGDGCPFLSTSICLKKHDNIMIIDRSFEDHPTQPKTYPAEV